MEFHGEYFDVPMCQMLPAPSRPIPIIGGGHSPVARGGPPRDGWVAAGAYSEDDAWLHLGALKDALKKVGRENEEGFAIYMSMAEQPSVELYRRFVVGGRHRHRVRAPGCSSNAAPGTPEDEALAARLDAVRWFADEIIAKM